MSARDKDSSLPLTRRDALTACAATAVAAAIPGTAAVARGETTNIDASPPPRQPSGKSSPSTSYGEYFGERLSRVAFPLGGMGAGMICLEGTGALSHFSLRNKPEVFNEPCTFAAISVKGFPRGARVLEGPVPGWKLFGQPGTGNGGVGMPFGLPRFREARFRTRFPFGTVSLHDPDVPLRVEITGWSPFEPGDADAASLPVAALEYCFTNATDSALEAVFSWNAVNFMALPGHAQAVRATRGGFVLWGGPGKNAPHEEGAFSASVSDPGVKVNHAWFRGGWFAPIRMAWRDIAAAACYDRPVLTEGKPSPGATLFVPLRLAPGESKTVAVRLAWYVGQTDLRVGKDSEQGVKNEPRATGDHSIPRSQTQGTYRPWYTARFQDIGQVTSYWRDHYDELRRNSRRFSDCFYDTTLPPEVIDATAANLTILKSPTVLRQADGRLWAWEGCSDSSGCCPGSCTHVWNYAQAVPHLFPALERTLRETEFGPSQDERGHQQFRSALPIRPLAHDFHAAADGQLGGILKLYRDWRILGAGGIEWLRRLWPKVRTCLDYSIRTWDPGRKGWLEEPHHNTYDIELWGSDGMCTSFYLAALAAAARMGKALGDDVSGYAELLEKGTARTEKELFNGEYFIQKVVWKGLQLNNPADRKTLAGDYSPEDRAILEEEGPNFQFGPGCLSDGVLGAWLALVCGVGQVLSAEKVSSHLNAVHRYNFKPDLTAHANPLRATYACGSEGGLVICTWPKGGEPSMPCAYCDEIWTGIEYQVASHLMLMGMVEEGLEIVRACRERYDGRVRNPFDEFDCGHWAARAMASYALIQSLGGARYDAVDKVLHLRPNIAGDFRSFLSTASGYGTVGIKAGKPFVEVRSGTIEIREIRT